MSVWSSLPEVNNILTLLVLNPLGSQEALAVQFLGFSTFFFPFQNLHCFSNLYDALSGAFGNRAKLAKRLTMYCCPTVFRYLNVSTLFLNLVDCFLSTTL